MNDVIVKLLIKSDTKRCHSFGRKCRAERVTILKIINNKIEINKHDLHTKYITKSNIIYDAWVEDFTIECAGGIHFFITRLEAEKY